MPTIDLHPHQQRAYASKTRITVLSAGIQSGKTQFGALWLGEQMMQAKPGQNLIIAAPTYKILTQATLPHFLGLFKRFGTYQKVDSYFEVHGTGVRVWIRSLTDPNALEGIKEVRGAWVDEGGLISRYAWENVDGRTAFLQAPIVISTTPYALNWLFQMWQQWKKGLRDDVTFIQFRSIDNPYFPVAEYERQKRLLHPRRFAMKYDGEFGKMEGLVYQNLKAIPSKALPAGTRYFGGIDWGFTHPFALTIRAVTPEGVHYRVAEYCKAGLTVDRIVDVVKARKQLYNIEMFVCDPADPEKILALNEAGCPAIAGENSIRMGIDIHDQLMREDRFFVFEDENPFGLDEYNTYHYPEVKELQFNDDAKEQLPVDANNHGCDSDRYVSVYLHRSLHKSTPQVPDGRRPEGYNARIEWLKRGGASRFSTTL